MVLPIETYTYALTRLRYLSAAASGIVATPPFTPDGKPALYCADQVALCQQAFGGLVTKATAASTAQGDMMSVFEASYDAAVSVYACMKSLYRSMPGVTQSILIIPNAEKVVEKTLSRMKALLTRWENLPNVPGTTGPMVVGPLTAGTFGSMTTDFEAKINAAGLLGGNYSAELAIFHRKLEVWNNFVSAGIEQGQALYAEGTGPRAFINRIPVAPSTQPPDEAEITSATSPTHGAVHLAFGADHATSFEVWHKGPGDEEFTQVGDVLVPGEYTATGLPAGTHEYFIVPVNSRGKGPASAPVSVAVAAAAAA